MPFDASYATSVHLSFFCWRYVETAALRFVRNLSRRYDRLATRAHAAFVTSGTLARVESAVEKLMRFLCFPDESRMESTGLAACQAYAACGARETTFLPTSVF